MKKKALEYRENEKGCFIVTSHRLNGDGYCYLRHEGSEKRAHRVVYQACFGEIEKGLVVRHKCDNPSCINPEHLELGTPKENAEDRAVRGRNAYGERNGSSRINDEYARKIKVMLRDGMMPTAISRSLGVSLKTVRGIRELNMWKHVAI